MRRFITIAWWAAMAGLGLDVAAGLLNIVFGDQSWFMPAMLGAFGFGAVAYLLGGQDTVNLDRFLDRFHTMSFFALFAGLVSVLALAIYHVVTHHPTALATDLLIAFVLGALLCVLIGTVNPKRDRS